MDNLVFLMLALVMVSGTNYAFAEQEYDYKIHPIEEYDLSDHPVFHPREYNTDRNFSSERYSHPAVSNPYHLELLNICLLYTSPSPRDLSTSRMPSSA